MMNPIMYMNSMMNYSSTVNKERNSKIHPISLNFEPLKVDAQYKDLLKNATINEEGIIKLDYSKEVSVYICEPKNRVIIIHPSINYINNMIDVSRLYFTHYGKNMFQEIEKEDTISSLKYIFNPAYYKKIIYSVEYLGTTYESIVSRGINSHDSRVYLHNCENYWLECYITDNEKRNGLINQHLCNRYIPSNYGVFGSAIPSQMCVGLNQIYNPNVPTKISESIVYSTAKIEYEKLSYKELEDMVKEQKIMIDEMTRTQKEIERIKLEKEHEKKQEEERLKILQKEQKKKELYKQKEQQRKKELERKIRKQLKNEEEIEQIKMRIKQENKKVTIHAKLPSKIDEVLIGVNKLSSNVKSNNRELVEVMKIFTENICDCIVENK